MGFVEGRGGEWSFTFGEGGGEKRRGRGVEERGFEKMGMKESETERFLEGGLGTEGGEGGRGDVVVGWWGGFLGLVFDGVWFVGLFWFGGGVVGLLGGAVVGVLSSPMILMHIFAFPLSHVG
ncbi:hypothetical protein Tco_1346865 [Tanacetum coccineum]